MIHCYTLRVLVDEYREAGPFRLFRTGSHWATVNVDFDENKFRTSALLQRLKGEKNGTATEVDGALVVSIDHGPLDS